MDPDGVVRIVQEGLMLAALLSAPAVLAAMAVGLIISILQAATQVQEQTLTTVPKILIVYLILAVTGLWCLRELMQFSLALFEQIAEVARK